MLIENEYENKKVFEFSKYILNWLSLSQNNYTINEIIDAILIKFNVNNETLHIPLDNHGKLLFNTKEPLIYLYNAIYYIKENYIIQCTKPKYFYYTYHQKPIKVINIII